MLRTTWLEKCTKSIQKIEIVWLLGRITKELSTWIEDVNKCREKQTWCIALVSRIQAIRERKIKLEVDEKEKMPLKLKIYGLGYWSCELR